MKILLEGAGFVNKGAEAMLRTVKTELSKRVPGLDFFIEISNIHNGTAEQAQNAGFHLFDRDQFSSKKKDLLLAFLKSPAKAIAAWENRKWFYGWTRAIPTFDAILDISGYRYAAVWGDAGFLKVETMVQLAAARGIPYIFLPQAWGPFEPSPGTRAGINILQNCTRYYARDSQSQKFLALLLGLPTFRIPIAPDIAFRFNPGEQVEAASTLRKLGIPPNRPLACISPNMRVYERAHGFGVENSYLKILIGIARALINAGAAVLCVPHEINPSLKDADDRVLCEYIRLAVGPSLPVGAVTSVATAPEIKILISRAEFTVGSRFHATVASLQSRVPAVVIGWSHKYEELLKSVNLPDAILDLSSTSPSQLIRKVMACWDQRKEAAAILHRTIPALEADVDNLFDEVVRLIAKDSARLSERVDHSKGV